MADTAHAAKTSFSKRVIRVFGFDLHSWEQLMLGSLGIAALAAVAVVLTTAAVVILTREENSNTKREFEGYKIEAAKESAQLKRETADANERAADATLKAEKERTARQAMLVELEPRTLSQEQHAALIAAARGKLKKVWIYVAPFDREAEHFGWILTLAFRDAGVDATIMPIPRPVLQLPELTVYDRRQSVRDEGSLFEMLVPLARKGLHSAGGNFPEASSNVFSQPAIIVGPKDPPLARQELPEAGRRPPPDVPWQPK